MVHNSRCETAKTPASQCRCSCRGRLHGRNYSNSENKPKRQKQKEQEPLELIRQNTVPIIKKATKIVIINSIPVVREVHACYSIASVLYDSWNVIYTVPQEIENSSDIIKSGVKYGLTNIQTEIVWSKIDKKVPEDLKNETKGVLAEIMGNISEEEINVVEKALGCF